MAKKTIKAWAGFTDGKLYLAFNSQQGRDETEYCIYKTKKAAKLDFDDVRPCVISFPKT